METNIVDIITAIVRESATAALAVLAIYMLKQSFEQRLQEQNRQVERWRAQMECEREDKLMLNQTLSEVAKRMGEMSEVLRQYRTGRTGA